MLTLYRCGLARRKGLGYPATSQEVAAFLRRSFARESENAGSLRKVDQPSPSYGVTTDDESFSYVLTIAHT